MLAKVFFRKVPSIARRQQPIFQLLGRLVSNHSYTFKKASRQVERRSLTWNERQLFSNSSHKWEIEHHKCKQKKGLMKVSFSRIVLFLREKQCIFKDEVTVSENYTQKLKELKEAVLAQMSLFRYFSSSVTRKGQLDSLL